MQKLRVLLVANEDPGKIGGGLGEFTGQMKQALRKLGVDARVLMLRYKKGNESRPSELVDYTATSRRGSRFPVATAEGRIVSASYRVLVDALPALNEFRPHVIHCNDRQSYFPFRGFPNVVFSLHFVYVDLYGFPALDERWLQEYKIERHALRNSPISIVYSRYMRRRVWDALAPRTSNIVLPLGGGEVTAEADTASADTASNEEKPRAKPRVVSFFGRFVQHHKGIHDFLKAAAAIRETDQLGSRLEFRAYGRGRIPERYRYDFVQWKGFVSGSRRMPRPTSWLCRVSTSRSVSSGSKRWVPDVCSWLRKVSGWMSFSGPTRMALPSHRIAKGSSRA